MPRTQSWSAGADSRKAARERREAEQTARANSKGNDRPSALALERRELRESYEAQKRGVNGPTKSPKDMGGRKPTPITKSGVLIAPRQGYTREQMGFLASTGELLGRFAPRTPQQTARGTGISLLAALAGVNPLASSVGGGLNAIYNGFQNTDDDEMEQSGWEYVRQRKLEIKPQQQKARDDLKGRDPVPKPPLPKLIPPSLPTAAQQGATTTQTDNAQAKTLAWLYPLLRTRAYEPDTYQNILRSSWGLRSEQRPGFRLTADR